MLEIQSLNSHLVGGHGAHDGCHTHGMGSLSAQEDLLARLRETNNWPKSVKRVIARECAGLVRKLLPHSVGACCNLLGPPDSHVMQTTNIWCVCICCGFAYSSRLRTSLFNIMNIIIYPRDIWQTFSIALRATWLLTWLGTPSKKTSLPRINPIQVSNKPHTGVNKNKHHSSQKTHTGVRKQNILLHVLFLLYISQGIAEFSWPSGPVARGPVGPWACGYNVVVWYSIIAL